MNKEEAIEKLREWIKPNDTLWTQLQHVSKSGMTRHIAVRHLKHSHDDECHPYDYTYIVAKAMGLKYSDKYHGIKVVGVGMDMGFHLIYGLGYTLWPNGTDEPHGVRNGEPDSAGGYAIKQRWL